MVERSFMDDFRRFFLRGLGALVPTLLTFALLVWAYKLVNENVGVYITKGLLHLCMVLRDEPAPWLLPREDLEKDALLYGQPINEWNDRGEQLTVEYKIIKNYKLLTESGTAADDPELLRSARKARNRAVWQIAFAKYRLHLLGFLIAIILVYFTGFFLASFIGRTSWRATEGVLTRIPLIRAVYPNIKKVTDFLLSERRVGFSGVVAVQYPRRGCWSLGLTTGGPMRQLQREVPDELVTVFIPSSPTPKTEYVIQVPRSDVIELNMTIDEGLRFTISGGVIKPEALRELPAEKDRPV
ncbi:MAG: DUF502 domain-containing protein [Planctomycetota bacterium]|nr:MAG: DUF502 domain-containing protein [Planctomycetota bacterium]